MVDLGVVGAAAEHDADDAVAPAGARLRDEHLAVRALFDALDLPDVDLDARVLDLGDRAAHQLGAQLRVVALDVAADGLQLRILGRHEQLEQELGLVLASQSLSRLSLASCSRLSAGLAVGVVADEHLGEVGVEAFDVRGEVLAVLEVEHRSARSARRASRASDPARVASAGTLEPNCSSTSTPVDGRVGAGADGLQHALEDQVLGVGDDRGLLGVGLAVDPEELLLEGAAVVEREDVELVVVAEGSWA